MGSLHTLHYCNYCLFASYFEITGASFTIITVFTAPSFLIKGNVNRAKRTTARSLKTSAFPVVNVWGLSLVD